jgi:hypothetical protein
MIETPLRHRKGSRITHWRPVSGRRRRQQAYAAPKRLSTRRLARRKLPTAAPRHRDPIVQAEVNHILNRADQRRRPAAIMLYITFGLSVALTILLGLIPKSGNQMTAAMRDTYVLLSNALAVINVALLAVSFVGQIILNGQALLLGSDTIAREKQNDTWDLLLLTGRASGELVMSKWRAVILYLLQRYWPMIVLRGASLLWLALTSPRSGGIIYNRPDIFSVALAPVIVIGATALDLMLASTIGVTASSAIRRGLAYPVALGLFFVTLFPFAIVYVLGNILTRSLYTGYFYISNGPLVMIAWPIDGGEMIGLNLMRTLDPREWVVLAAVVAGNLLMFAALVAALLWIARQLAGQSSLRRPKSSAA